MIDIPVNFLSSRLPIVGLVGYTIHTPYGEVEVHCLSKSLYPASAEHLLKAAVQDSRNLLPAGEVSAQYCWSFDCMRVYVAARADGGCLALLVENNPGVQMVRIQQALQDYIELAPVEA